MNIALLAQENRRELMVQFCTAYCGILAKHTLCSTAATAAQVAEATGLSVYRFLEFYSGGDQQIAARIAYNEIDLVFALTDPTEKTLTDSLINVIKLCDQNNVPIATNLATAEMLILGLARGDLDWRDIVNPKSQPFLA